MLLKNGSGFRGNIGYDWVILKPKTMYLHGPSGFLRGSERPTKQLLPRSPWQDLESRNPYGFLFSIAAQRSVPLTIKHMSRS